MIDLLDTLLHGDLAVLLGELYEPTCALVAAGGILIALGGVVELFVYTFRVIFGMGGK